MPLLNFTEYPDGAPVPWLDEVERMLATSLLHDLVPTAIMVGPEVASFILVGDGVCARDEFCGVPIRLMKGEGVALRTVAKR